MARTSSQILPYWQFEVGLLDDLKVIDLVDKYGSLGFMILCAIYTIATNTNGYYAEINEQLILSIYRTIGNKWIKNRSFVSEVIDYCGVCGLFDVNLLSQNVITSRGMQRRWLYVKQKSRAKGYLTAKYWLIGDEQVQDILLLDENKCSTNVDKCNINSDKCSTNSYIKSIQDNESEGNIIDSQTAEANKAEVEFYLDNINFRTQQLGEEFIDYKQRIENIAVQAVKVAPLTIGKVQVSIVEFLKALDGIFREPNQFHEIFNAIDNKPTIKNKFLYTAAVIYNTEKKF